MSQDAVSRMEQRSDLLLSMLRRTVEAVGGSLSLIARFPDRPPVELSGIAERGSRDRGCWPSHIRYDLDLVEYRWQGAETMAMKDPPHPGLGIRENCLAPHGLNVTEAARVLGVARHTLSRVLNGRAAISSEMAIRLEKAGWSDAEFWLRRQSTYDLTQARKGEDRIAVKRYAPRHTA